MHLVTSFSAPCFSTYNAVNAVAASCEEIDALIVIPIKFMILSLVPWYYVKLRPFTQWEANGEADNLK